MNNSSQLLHKPLMLVEAMQQKETDAVKDRGAYYTPKAISDFLVDWGLQEVKNPSNILEPSCGDGIFLRSLSESLNSKKNNTTRVLAIEMNRAEAKKARKVLKPFKKMQEITSNVVTSEYFSYMSASSERSQRKFDLILGNPPYVKQSKFESGREQALSRMKELGLKINQQSNAWVYFVIDAISRMSYNSRIGLVIPSDLLQLDYAKEVQDWITRNLDNTLLIGFEELVFPKIQQDVVLLLGEKKKNSKGKKLGLISVKNTSKLTDDLWKQFLSTKQSTDCENIDWNLQYLPDSQLSVIDRISSKPEFHAFGDIADAKIGIVTGANKFFCVQKETLKDLKIRRGLNKGLVVRKLIGSRIEIKGIEYKQSDHEKNHFRNKATSLLDFNTTFVRSELPNEIKTYLELGEKLKLHKRNQLKRRDPWYSSEHVLTTRIGMYKRSNDYCKLILKPNDVYSTDTVYRIILSQEYIDTITPKQLVFNFVNSLTYLFCEMKGRSYGGGVLELTPKEIRAIKVPLYQCTDEEFSKLDDMFRKNRPIDEILNYSDDVILKFLTESEKKSLRNSWHTLKNRRNKRPKKGV
jgi:adenine-specific DNA-methyltransferase